MSLLNRELKETNKSFKSSFASTSKTGNPVKYPSLRYLSFSSFVSLLTLFEILNIKTSYQLQFYNTSNKPAAPCPPPIHIVTTAYLIFLLLPSINA